MKAKELTTTALLASLMYIVYTIGSGLMYFELLNFTILLYGVTFKRRVSYLSTLVFTLVIILTKGFGVWTFMYLLIFPVYALLYSYAGKYTASEYSLAAMGFFLALICGTLIDIPYIYMSGLDYRGLIIRLLLGLQVSIVNAGTTFVATLFLLNPIRSSLLRSLGSCSTGNEDLLLPEKVILKN